MQPLLVTYSVDGEERAGTMVDVDLEANLALVFGTRLSDRWLRWVPTHEIHVRGLAPRPS